MASATDVCCATVCGVITVLLVGALLTAGVLKLSSAIGKQWEDEDLSCNPRVYVLDLYAPALLNHNNTSLNSSVFIDLGFIRGAPVSGAVAMYRDLSINLYYGEDPSYPVANRTIPSFRMGERRRVHYSAVAEAPGLPWEDAFNKLSAGSTVDLRLELLGEFKPMDYCGGTGRSSRFRLRCGSMPPPTCFQTLPSYSPYNISLSDRGYINIVSQFFYIFNYMFSDSH